MKALIVTSLIALAGLTLASRAESATMVTKVCHVRAFDQFDTKRERHQDDLQQRAVVRDFGDTFVVNYSDALINVMSPDLQPVQGKKYLAGFTKMDTGEILGFIADSDGSYSIFPEKGKWAFKFFNCEVTG